MATGDSRRYGFLDAVQTALANMDGRFTQLSRLRYRELPAPVIEMLREEKMQERPFAYEFYHQLRMLWEADAIPLITNKEMVVQGEVNKTYQNFPELRKSPDFILHKVGSVRTSRQLAVLEFKLASSVKYTKLRENGKVLCEARYDFEKLNLFQQKLRYEYPIEVVLGPTRERDDAKAYIDSLCDLIDDPTKANLVRGTSRVRGVIYVIYFDTTKWSSTIDWVIYPKRSKVTGRRSTAFGG